MDYILERLKEPSTWKGIVGLVMALGVFLNPEQIAAIVSAGTAVAALINVFRKEVKLPDDKK